MKKATPAKPPKPSKPSPLEEARLLLVRRRSELLGRRSALLHEEEELIETTEADWEDTAANRTATEALAQLSEIELAQLRRITAALARIEAGTYGTCLVCEETIPAARLAVMPEATTCAACAATSGR